MISKILKYCIVYDIKMYTGCYGIKTAKCLHIDYISIAECMIITLLSYNIYIALLVRILYVCICGKDIAAGDWISAENLDSSTPRSFF